MARHHGRFMLAREFKNSLRWILKLIADKSPLIRNLLRFYPVSDIPKSIKWIERSEIKTPIDQTKYTDWKNFLKNYNVDAKNIFEPYVRENYTFRAFASINNAVLLGHTFRGVDRFSAKSISLTGPSELNWNFAHPSLLRNHYVQGTAIAFPFYANYYHLLVDSFFPTAYALRRASAEKKITIIASNTKNPVYRSCLAALAAISGADVDTISRWDAVVSDELIYGGSYGANPELSFCYPELIDQLRETLLKVMNVPRVYNTHVRPIYFRRGNTKLRYVKGEDALAEGLSREGYEIFEPRWSNFDQQIQKAHSASRLVSIHGASLANILWMRDGADVFEIMAFNARKLTYLHLASYIGVNYHGILGEIELAKQHFNISVGKTLAELSL